MNIDGPFLIGLTGNIATGKSEVGRILQRLGACVIDADRVAHEVMRPGGPAYEPVLQAFGRQILAPGGTLDRAKLGTIVFRDAEALRRLEAAVHPATKARVDELIAQATVPVVVVEAIKLIEAGMHRRCDELWVVTARRCLQIRRLVEQRGMSEDEAALRVDSQSPQQQKVALADRLFVNDGNLEELDKCVREAWQEIRANMTAQDSGENLEVRRAGRSDLASIAALVRKATRSRLEVDEATVQEWLFGKGLWVVEQDGTVVGVAAWQAENLVSVTDVFQISPARLRAAAGGRLLETIEAEANVLMCEANVVVLPAWTSEAMRGFLNKQGYELKAIEELHRIWREVLGDFVGGDQDLMVKRLRERMVMVPI